MKVLVHVDCIVTPLLRSKIWDCQRFLSSEYGQNIVGDLGDRVYVDPEGYLCAENGNRHYTYSGDGAVLAVLPETDEIVNSEIRVINGRIESVGSVIGLKAGPIWHRNQTKPRVVTDTDTEAAQVFSFLRGMKWTDKFFGGSAIWKLDQPTKAPYAYDTECPATLGLMVAQVREAGLRIFGKSGLYEYWHVRARPATEGSATYLWEGRTPEKGITEVFETEAEAVVAEMKRLQHIRANSNRL